MIDLQPTICNLCGGKVEYISNDKIYGKKYGSGYCYHCTQCNAYVGTHKPRPKEALGILANDEMKNWKQWCHREFDILWKGCQEYKKADGTIVKARKPKYSRAKCYKLLADAMGIPMSECHFGYFDIKQLRHAYAVLKNGKL